MSKKAEIMKKLYDAGKVTLDGLKKAVADGVITEGEYTEIVGETDLESMTVFDLRSYAEEHGIDLTGKTKKADIIEAIRA